MRELLYGRGVKPINTLLKAEIARQKVLQGKTDKEIAKLTGYSYSSIRKVMCGRYIGDSEKVTNAIARALNIER